MSYPQNDELKTYLAQKATEFIAASRNHDTQPPSSPSGSGFSLEDDSQIAASAPPMLEDTDPELQAVIDQAVAEVSPYRVKDAHKAPTAQLEIGDESDNDEEPPSDQDDDWLLNGQEDDEPLGGRQLEPLDHQDDESIYDQEQV